MPLLLVFIGAVPVLIALRLATAPVTSGRVVRFARRHRLALTLDNQPHIVSYLLQTRRWRTVGVLGAYLASLTWMLPRQRTVLEVSALLAGWLFGAVIAEVRSRPPREAGHGQAPVDAVVPGWLLRVPLTLAATAIGVTAFVLALPGTEGRSGQLLVWGTGALACAAVVAATNRYVGNGPANTDDAATGRAAAAHSIGAITAIGSVLALSCLIYQLDVIQGQFFGAAATAVAGIGLLWTVGALGVAWFIASASWPVAQTGPAPRPRPLGRLLMVVAALGVASATWAGYAWWKDHPPYPAAAIQATVTIRLTDDARFDQDARALDVTGLTNLQGGPDDQQFIGRVDYVTPALASADDMYHVIVIDKRQNRVAPLLFGTEGGGWSGYLSQLPRRYPWLSAMAPNINGFSDGRSAVTATANTPGPLTFVGSFPDAVGLSPSDIMVVIVFAGPDGQTYWATRVTG